MPTLNVVIGRPSWLRAVAVSPVTAVDDNAEEDSASAVSLLPLVLFLVVAC